MKTKKILMIDDARVNRKILKAIFDDHYEICEAENKEELLSFSDQLRTFSLIIMNLRIAKQNDFNIMHYFSALNLFRQVPVMILTTGRDLEEEIQVLDQGAAEIIHRPYAPEIIQRRAENLIELYESRRVTPMALSDGIPLNLMKSQTINVFWKDRNRRFVGANNKFLETYGFTDVSEIVGKTDEDMGWHVDEGPFQEDEWRVLEHGEVIQNQIGNCIIQGVAHNILASKEPIYRDGRIIGLMGFFVSVDDLHIKSGAPTSIELKDKVTGLMSTHGVTNMLSEYAEGWTMRNENFAVIRISVSEYYRATRTQGEKAATQMLIDMSRMIKDIFGRDGTCARIYEGNFVVLLKCKDKNYVKSISTLILERLKKVHMLAGHAAATNPEVQIYFADEIRNLQDMLVLACGGNIFDIEEIHAER